MPQIRSLVALAALYAVGAAWAQQAPADEPGWAKGRPKTDTAMKMAPGAGVPDPDARPTSCRSSQVQAAARLQGRDLGIRRARCARAAPGRQGQHLRQHAVRRQQGLRASPRRRQARGQGHHRQHADMATGIEFHKGSLYVATNTKIMRYDNVEDKLDKPRRAQGHLRQAARRQTTTAGSTCASRTTSCTTTSARRATSAIRASTPRSTA